jgi:hypothetical protein
MQPTLDQNVSLVQIRATKWSGTRQVPKNDPNLRVDDPPPDKVWRSWGSKAVFDQEELRVFDAIEKEADRSALSVGTRFLLPRQYVIHADQAPALELILQDCKRRHEAARNDLVSRYDQILESFVASNRQWEAFIRASAMQPEHVATKFRFDYLVIPIEGAAVAVIEEQAPALAAGILGEIETMGKDLIRALTGRDAMTRRGLGPFKRIRDKLDALSFVDQRFQPIIDTIDAWVACIPRNGPIDGHLFSEAYGLALMLGDVERMAAHGAGRIAGQKTAPPMAEASDPAEPAETPADEASDDADALEAALAAIFSDAPSEDDREPQQEPGDGTKPSPTPTPSQSAGVIDDGWF